MVQFNKMMVMLPVMLAARKLDSEDPKIIYWLRLLYGIMQSITLVIVLYTYKVATSTTTIQNQNKNDTIVYVPPPPQPFADPNAKKKYTKISFHAHVASTARSLVGSTLFGMCLTIGLHYYKGMVMGLFIQTIMAPFNLCENPLIYALFISSSKSINCNDKIFGEKYNLSELNPDDEIVDEHGNIVLRSTITNNNNRQQQQQKKNNNEIIKSESTATAANDSTTDDGDGETKQRSLEEIMLDTWDSGSKADLKPFMNALNENNINTITSEDHWTPLMIVSGLGSPSTASAIKQLIAFGADVTATDIEGWNCYHWAGYHGSILAAKELCNATGNANHNYFVPELLTVQDKEGDTPSSLARKQGNHAVADIFDEATKLATAAANTNADTKKDK